MAYLAKHATRFSVVILCVTVSSCTTVKTTKSGTIGIERAQRMSPLISEDDLQAGATLAYLQIIEQEKSKGTLNSDAELSRRVRGIAQKLIPAVNVFREDALKWDWQVNVIQSDQLNAWAMPGGKIAFYSGIIERLELTDGEIAAIMGHEIAHALREHSRERASEQATTGLAIGVGGALLGLGGGATDMANLAYNSTFGVKHSRSHETEADRIGVELAARSGFDPREAISVWQKMAKETGGSSGPEWLSTHPSNETRIADLMVYSEKVLGLYQSSR